MTLRQLGEQYLREAGCVRERIRVLRPTADNAKAAQAEALRSRISSLYSIAADAERIGRYLIDYTEVQ